MQSTCGLKNGICTLCAILKALDFTGFFSINAYMALIVQKYGGTSVGSIDLINTAAKRVLKSHEEGFQIVVVVSAMEGETDRLISLAKKITNNLPSREYDVLLSTGEQVTASLLAMAIEKLGHGAVSFMGHQVQINTSEMYSRAKIESIEITKVIDAINKDKIVIIPGFQGVRKDGDITTLGRGGSDITAVALAVALNAERVEFYKDVDGIFTANPAICPKARLIKKISAEEMLELAHLGAKVLHFRSVELARRNNIPLIVRSSLNYNSGSLVTPREEEMEEAIVTGIVYDKEQAKFSILNIPDVPDVLAKIFSTIAGEEVNIDMIVQNTLKRDKSIELSFTCYNHDLKLAQMAVEKIIEDIPGVEYLVENDLSKLSIVGAGMKAHSGVASKMFSALASEGIKVFMVNTSEIKISCLIETKYIELAVRILHDVFELEK